ncbi:MAG: winged helix-turn-helix domain-containing protein [Sedimentisphaerales bacterium]|nr:winged helix-turn-helix domain-containing protein [Sedimentisphaerales bacterium]
MEETIGNVAGEIWTLLSNRKNPVNVTELPKLVKSTPQLTYQGLGWLAREGKVVYTEKSGKTAVSLSPAEVCCC